MAPPAASVEFEAIKGAVLETVTVVSAAAVCCSNFKTASELCAIQSAAAPLIAQLKKAVMNGLDFVNVMNAPIAAAAGTALHFVLLLIVAILGACDFGE